MVLRRSCYHDIHEKLQKRTLGRGACTQGIYQYHPQGGYPYVERDVAVVVDEAVPASEITRIILAFPSEIIEEVSIFDYFKEGNIPAGKKSLAFSIVYRSKEKTLTDEEVERLHSSLVAQIIKTTGGELRK